MKYSDTFDAEGEGVRCHRLRGRSKQNRVTFYDREVAHFRKKCFLNDGLLNPKSSG